MRAARTPVHRSIRKPISFSEIYVQVRSTGPGGVGVAVRSAMAAGTAVGTCKTSGRIMSFSSWPRMWQCQVYS